MVTEATLALLDAVLVATEAAGTPALPAGRRDEAVALLTRLMHDDRLFDAYHAAVTARRRRDPLVARPADLDSVMLRQVSASGFVLLSDRQLAGLVTSAERLESLADRLFDPDLDAERGDWFFRRPPPPVD